MKTKWSGALTRMEPGVYALMRVVVGALFSVHGVQKIFGWFSTKPPVAVGSQIGMGGLIELCTGVLIAIGLFTRPAAFLASGTMAVAYFQFHWKLQFSGGNWLPVINRGELAAVYCFVLLFIATYGPGVASLDGWRDRRIRP